MTVAEGQRGSATRFSYELEYGPPSDACDVVPICGNRRCVRPAHLGLVTRRGSWRRGYRLGRRPKTARLTPAQAAAVRELYASGRSYRELAEVFGVAHTTVRSIVTEASWKRRYELPEIVIQPGHRIKPADRRHSAETIPAK